MRCSTTFVPLGHKRFIFLFSKKSKIIICLRRQKFVNINNNCKTFINVLIFLRLAEYRLSSSYVSKRYQGNWKGTHWVRSVVEKTALPLPLESRQMKWKIRYFHCPFLSICQSESMQIESVLRQCCISLVYFKTSVKSVCVPKICFYTINIEEGRAES